MFQLWHKKEAVSSTGGGKDVFLKKKKKTGSCFGTSHEAVNGLPQT